MQDPQEARRRAQAEEYLAHCTEYSDAYEHEKLVRDWVKKEEVAKNVVGDFERRAGEVRGKRLLDVGFGNGLYAVAFAAAGARVSGLEVNPVLLDIARGIVKERGVQTDLRLYDGSKFPYEDASFDHAYSISVLEHVDDPRTVLREVHRVLRTGGTFYLTFPNRFAPKETHTGIWGLNYLPRSVAAFLLRRVWGRNTVEEINLHFISYWKMKRMMRGTSLKVRYEDTKGSFPKRVLKKILAALGMHHSAILRTIMVVLEKR